MTLGVGGSIPLTHPIYHIYCKNIPIIYNMKGEVRLFDPAKSRNNKEKHGIDFEEAQALWDGSVEEIPVFTIDEPRWLVIGKISNVFWTAVITRREDSTRIISVRRSRKEEKALYEK